MTRYNLIGPEGPTSPEPADSLDELMRRAMAFGMSMGHQGYYKDSRMQQQPLEWVLANCRVEVEEIDEAFADVDEEAECFVLWLPGLGVESFESEDDAKSEIMAMDSRGGTSWMFNDLDELKRERDTILARRNTN